MQTVKTNDLKKGTAVIFKDGRSGVLMDNKRGNIRCVKVGGPYADMGDCYMHTLHMAILDGQHVKVELTPAQIKLQQTVANMWG
jgi:hypothetical protein